MKSSLTFDTSPIWRARVAESVFRSAHVLAGKRYVYADTDIIVLSITAKEIYPMAFAEYSAPISVNFSSVITTLVVEFCALSGFLQRNIGFAISVQLIMFYRNDCMTA